ncbi:hypothetical protein D3C83_296080 [compost metagenome]
MLVPRELSSEQMDELQESVDAFTSATEAASRSIVDTIGRILNVDTAMNTDLKGAAAN